MKPAKEIEINTVGLAISVSARLQLLLHSILPAFQSTLSLARPMGLEDKVCEQAAMLCQRFIEQAEQALSREEVEVFLHILKLTQRELCARLHIELRELQQTMATLISARTSKEIELAVHKLLPQAARSSKGLQNALKNYKELLDECERLSNRLHKQLKTVAPSN
jgi:hypothetical protein